MAGQAQHGLGPTIKALRKLRGMTQEQLALRVGMQRTSITNIELGNQIVTETSLAAIAKALGYQVKIRFVASGSSDA